VRSLVALGEEGGHGWMTGERGYHQPLYHYQRRRIEKTLDWKDLRGLRNPPTQRGVG
jgi:hypothetical protein